MSGRKERHMPYVNYGDPFNTGGSQFLKLKSKGDKVRIRLLGSPFVEGKHFFELDAGQWDIRPCPRINDGDHCDHCSKYFELVSKAKKEGDKKELERVQKENRSLKAAISFYFPVLNRDTAEFNIFQSVLSVRNQIEAEVEIGTKVLEVDFVVLRTEAPGAGYYKVSRVDSSDTPPLSPEEKDAIKEYKKIDLAQLINGSKDEAGISVEEESEIVD